MDIVQSQRTVTAHPDMSRISQETLAIIGAGIALAALILTGTAGVRGEIQDVRDEIRAVRAEARADREVLRAEARTDREALRAEARADREAFQSHILRLTEQQGMLGARIDGITDHLVTAR